MISLLGSALSLGAMTTTFAVSGAGARVVQSSEQCRASSERSATDLIRRSIDAVGLENMSGAVLRVEASDEISMAFQSDRMYPPYLTRGLVQRIETDFDRGRQAIQQGSGQNVIRYVSDATRRVVFPPRGGAPVAIPASAAVADERALSPWMVLADWRAASDVRVAQECYYRDYWRVVLARKGPFGEERLYVDPETAMPVKLQRQEPDVLWGDRKVEYLWSIWTPVGSALAPMFSFRIIEGEVDQTRRMTQQSLVPLDSVPLDIPSNVQERPANALADPDTVRVAENTFLLVTRAYTNVVTLQRDTLFILDAQTSEARARADSAWIARLFPGRHPTVLVVTDLAWPHISGVRFWVASGARVISHRASREFLTKVVEHRWTLQPDKLESRRAQVRFDFVPVDESLDLAGGAVRLRSIDGVGSEGALLAFVPDAAFLYPGDYIQPGGPQGSTSFTAQYAREVEAAVSRAGFNPQSFAAMHVKLTPWSQLGNFVRRE
jgi:hypothetical protein